MMVLDIAVFVGAVGHLGERQVGNLRERLGRTSFDAAFSSASSAGIVSFSALTSAISFCAARLVLLFLASPISFDAEFRRACAASEFLDHRAAALVNPDQVRRRELRLGLRRRAGGGSAPCRTRLRFRESS